MSNLPENWTKVTLADVGEITTGNTPPTKQTENYGGGIPFVKPGDLDYPLPITKTEQTLSKKGAEYARLLRPGSVMVSCIGNLGKIGIAGITLATNQQINSIEFTPSLVDDRYGYYFCKTLKPWMEQEASATTVTILNKGRFSKAPFILAPLDEQKRIAEKLDTLLARVDSCQTHLERVPQILKRFRQSVLAAATSGRLTEDWREEHAVNGEWEETTVEGIAEVFLGRQRSPKNHFGKHMRKYVRAANVTWNGLDFSDVKEMNFDPRDFERYKLRVGDVLLNEGSGSADEVGKPAIWNGEIEDCCFQNTLICVRPHKALSKYLYYLFLYTAMAKIFVKDTRGVNIFHIGKEKLANFEVSMPSLEEQAEIVRRVEKLFAYAERLEARYYSASEHVERLTPSLLAKAFRGELVGQDANDESAEKLLEKVKAGREDVKPQKASPHGKKATGKK